MNTCRECGGPQSATAPTCLLCGSDCRAIQMALRGILTVLVLVALLVLAVVLWLP